MGLGIVMGGICGIVAGILMFASGADYPVISRTEMVGTVVFFAGVVAVPVGMVIHVVSVTGGSWRRR